MAKKGKNEDGVRIITKYQNRRLYDHSIGKYVCLPDLVNMIDMGIQIRVRQKESGQDITEVTLLAALAELVDGSPSGTIFDAVSLHTLLRAPVAAGRALRAALVALGPRER